MNTTIKFTIITVVIVAALALAGTGLTWAQSMSPWGGNGSNMMGRYGGQDGTPEYGDGMMGGGYGMMGNGEGMMNGQNRMTGVDMNAMHQWMATSGGMHTAVWGDLAETLGLTPKELNAELAGGKTLTQVAEARGVSQEQLTGTLETAIRAGLAQAVTDGAITLEQADQMLGTMSGNFGWMLTHMGSMGGGFSPNNCHENFGSRNNP